MDDGPVLGRVLGRAAVDLPQSLLDKVATILAEAQRGER